jgi:uncharacterized protein YqgC (DUF456 family)
MDWIWIALGILLCLIAIGGSILPLLPGPPIAYGGLVLQQLREPNPFDGRFLVMWCVIVIVTMILDYVIPVQGTKRFGGTKYGVWGCTIGFLAAFWMGPWGVVIGPFVGAFIGELIANQSSKNAFRAALGSFVGFLLSTFLKLVVCFFMLYYIIESIGG